MNALSSKAASLRAASEAIKKVSFVYAYVLSSTFSPHASDLNADFLRLGAYDYESCMTLRFAKHWKQEDDAPKLRRRNAMVHCDG